MHLVFFGVFRPFSSEGKLAAVVFFCSAKSSPHNSWPAGQWRAHAASFVHPIFASRALGTSKPDTRDQTLIR